MNIYLIGYRCTGKSSVGKALAEAINWDFIDLDDFLVETAGNSIAQIVARNGWAHFRQMERDVLKKVSETNRTVVATGGGIVLNPINVKRIRETGHVIWLRADIDTIHKRMTVDGKTADFRPALSSMDEAEEIKETLMERRSLYRNAQDFMVETDNLSIERICSLLVDHLQKEKVIP